MHTRSASRPSASFSQIYFTPFKKPFYPTRVIPSFHYAGTSMRKPSFPSTNDLLNCTIEEMVAKLSPLQKKSIAGLTTGAMSYGSISLKAHTTIAEGVNRLAMAIYGVTSLKELKKIPGFKGPMSNSGEGGELTVRNNSPQQSMRRQVASARFGVNGAYLASAYELEIKINQGAKPGIGGELPGKKVTPLIAQARLTVPGITLASPPPHHDIYSIEDLKQLIRNLRSANPRARIGVKLAASAGLGVIAAGVVKCGADFINIAGPGGTGAAPTTAKFEFVHPWETALSETHQTLVPEGLRDSVSIIISGGIQTGLDCFKALLFGANVAEVGTSALVSMGCVMAEVCHEGSCPAGIATTNQELVDQKFKGTPEDVARSLIQTGISLSDYLDTYGFTDPEQAVGQTQLLEVKDRTPLTGLDKLLYKPKSAFSAGVKIIRDGGSSYEEQTIIWGILSGKKNFTVEASNQILSFGARIGYYTHTDDNFRSAYYEKPINVTFRGLSCGQSFGFVAPPNLTLVAENANDNTGGLLDGATIYIKNLAGNVAGFGATRGHIFAKETGGRTGTRNSGAHIMVEKSGADAAGFMTGGTFTLLAHSDFYPGLRKKNKKQPARFLNQEVIGPNFGSGFTGGVVYLPAALYKKMHQDHFLSPSALGIKTQPLTDLELTELIERLEAYRKEIDSELVTALLKLDRETLRNYFIKLDPAVKNEYKADPTPLVVSSTVEESVPILDAFHLVAPNQSSSNQPEAGLYDASKAEKDACGTGVVVNRDGQPTRKLINDAVTMLARFMHRGASGIDPETGDGCGIVWYGTDRFFQTKFPDLGLVNGNYGVIHVALPKDTDERSKALHLLQQQLTQEGLAVAGEREVPVNNRVLGYIGKQLEPAMLQWIIKKPASQSQEEFDKKLIRTHLRFEFLIQAEKKNYKIPPHIISAASNNVIYKAMTKENKIGDYFLDFHDPAFEAHTAATHARFSTNTFPSFENIQLFRNLGNNGENNALQQIINALTLDPLLKDLLGLESIDLTGFSDSHIMSIFIDMLRLLGYSAEDIVAFTIHPYDPSHQPSSEYYNLFGVPFEGPNASIVTIGDMILVVRDRNGFRPQRGVINAETFYCGSELGAVDIQGETFNLEPAKPIIIDLKKKSILSYQADVAKQAFHAEQINSLKKCTPQFYHKLLPFPGEELHLRKKRAGWSKELDDKIMQPLFKGQDAVVSMGDQRPIEALIRKSHFDIGAFFKGNISQVTNPALDPKRERAYMSSLTFVGAKPSLENVGTAMARGFLLPSPIVNNDEMMALKHDKLLRTHTINIIFPIKDFEDGMKLAIEQICCEAVERVRKGTTFLVLSDVRSDDNHAAIPPLIVASFVHEALLKAGLRRQASIGLQSASTLTPRDVAQVISIGGVDIINPYLPFISVNDQEATDEFNKRCQRYQNTLCTELLGIMARVGVSTVSAYRGTKAFNAYGIDADLAKKLGVSSLLGGVGMREITAMTITQHQQPKSQGLGRFDSESEEREKQWDALNTRAFIERARCKQDNSIEARMDLLKRATPRGQFFLRPSQIWTEKNPMTICILGGGAAGFYQAQLLLDAKLPIRLIIIEQNHVNRFGLVGNGIAPDHVGTKNQARILRDVLMDSRVTYYGGVEVGKDVSLPELKAIYPCIVDCRGAAIDVKLNIPGESSKRVVPASVVYKGYNNAFDPLRDAEENWPFFYESKLPDIGIIGNGNVAADIARVFLKEPDAFKRTSINPRFLALLETNAPDGVRIFARSSPTKSKISLSELEQLKNIKEVWLTATFDESKIDVTQLSADEQKLYAFFKEIKDRTPPTTYIKRLHFHFNCTPKAFLDQGNGIEALFMGPNNEEQRFRAKAFITSIGTQFQPLGPLDEQCYASGWAMGKGGKLSWAEKSAEETANTIKQNFAKGVFHHTKPPVTEQAWQLKSAVGNVEQQNLLDYLDEGHHINSIADFRFARQYRHPKEALAPVAEVSSHQPGMIPLQRVSTVPIPEKDKVIVYDPATGQSKAYEASGEETLLERLKQDNNAPSCQCNGDQQCGECIITTINNPIQSTKKEIKLIKANGQDPDKSILSCSRKMRELGQGVFVSPREMKNANQNPATTEAIKGEGMKRTPTK